MVTSKWEPATGNKKKKRACEEGRPLSVRASQTSGLGKTGWDSPHLKKLVKQLKKCTTGPAPRRIERNKTRTRTNTKNQSTDETDPIARAPLAEKKR